MSFADDLRKISREANQTKNYREIVNDIVRNYTPAILEHLRLYASKGSVNVKGYLRLSYDNEYGPSYHAWIEEIDPKAFESKPRVPGSSYGGDPYGAICGCAFCFSEDERELTDGMRLLRQGFLNSLSKCGFRKLLIDSITTTRYDLVKGVFGEQYRRNANLNYHLLYLDIEW